MPTRKPAVNLQETFDEIEAMLEHHRALIALAHKQDATQRGLAEQLQQRQNAVELRRRASGLHPADLAVVLEGLAPDDRLPIWEALEPQQAAEVMVELDAPARAWLVNQTDRYRLTKIVSTCDPDDLAWMADELPDEVMREVRRSLGEIDRQLLSRPTNIRRTPSGGS